MAKKQTTEIVKLKVFRTLKESSIQYKQNWWLFTKTTFVVALPVGLLQLIQTDAFNGDSTIAASIAWMYAIMAILYLALTANIPSKKLRDMYTTVSGRFLQYLLATLILVVFSLPLLAAIFVAVLIVPIYGALFWLPALGLLVFSAYLYSRFILALPAIIEKPITSFAALSRASKLSRKNHMRIIATIGILLFAIIILLTIVSSIIGLSEALNQNKLFSSLVYVVEATIFTPIIMVTIAKCYKNLS